MVGKSHFHFNKHHCLACHTTTIQHYVYVLLLMLIHICFTHKKVHSRILNKGNCLFFLNIKKNFSRLVEYVSVLAAVFQLHFIIIISSQIWLSTPTPGMTTNFFFLLAFSSWNIFLKNFLRRGQMNDPSIWMKHFFHVQFSTSFCLARGSHEKLFGLTLHPKWGLNRRNLF